MGKPMIPPKWYRSMCCVNNETALKFVSMKGYNQGIPMAAVTLSMWILVSGAPPEPDRMEVALVPISPHRRSLAQPTLQ